VKVVELVDVAKHYGAVRALDGVSASFESGTLTHVAGPNGAGKSTLLRVIAGLTRQTRGRVNVLDVDLFRSLHARERGRVGYLGPEAGLYGELTLTENLRFCARLHGVSESRIDAVLQRLDLGQVRARPVSTLSLGFRRRAGLSRLLVTDCELWLLDEPWNGLDADASASLAGELRAHRESGRTALVAAHVVGDYAALFDRGVVLHGGRLADA